MKQEEQQVAEETGKVVQQHADDPIAEEAFAAGVAITTGHTPPVTEDGEGGKKVEAAASTTTDDGKAKAEATAKAAADAEAKRVADAAAADPWKDVPAIVREQFKKLEALPDAVNKLAGHIGGFKRTIETLSATADAAAAKKSEVVAAPTKVEIAEAMTDPDAWEKLKKDFPEWMDPIAAELTRLRKDVATVAKAANERPAAPAAAPAAQPAAAQEIDTEAIMAGAEERAVVRMKHPDWKLICASPEFGVKNKDGKYVSGWLSTQPPEMLAKANSDNAEDAIAVFDAYKEDKKKLADEAAKRAAQEKRLQAAVPVKGSAEPPQAGLDDDAAFNAGVKNTLRKG